MSKFPTYQADIVVRGAKLLACGVVDSPSIVGEARRVAPKRVVRKICHVRAIFEDHALC